MWRCLCRGLHVKVGNGEKGRLNGSRRFLKGAAKVWRSGGEGGFRAVPRGEEVGEGTSPTDSGGRLTAAWSWCL
jgi:hypothetical protein